MINALSASILLLITGALVGVYVFIVDQHAVEALLGGPKVFEITYQFLLVTVVGGAIALLYKQLDQLREKRRALRDMYSELLAAFNQAKRVRRHLRARLGALRVIQPGTKITAEDYDEEMDRLGDAQLTFEVYVKRAANSSLWFSGARGLAQNLRDVESYLNAILKEYQEMRSGFVGDPPEKDLTDLKRLSEFLLPFDDEDGVKQTGQALTFREHFKNASRNALVELGKVALR